MIIPRSRIPIAPAFAALLSLPACLDDGDCGLYDACSEAAEGDAEQGMDAAEDNDTDAETAGEVETCEGPERLTIVDASDEASWVYFDLDSCARVEADDDWDLGFQRFGVILNGGVSGDGSVEGTYVDGVDLADLSAAPADAVWSTDAPDADDDGEPELVFIDWYDYDISTHVLTAKPRVYVVRSTDAQPFAVQLVDYYNEAGSSGHITLRHKPLE